MSPRVTVLAADAACECREGGGLLVQNFKRLESKVAQPIEMTRAFVGPR